MKIEIGKYTITTEDSYNFGLYETKTKGSFRGKQAEGTTEKLIGYYGRLSDAMSKIVNETVLTSDEHFTAESLKVLILTVESNLNDAYDKVKPRDYPKETTND